MVKVAHVLNPFLAKNHPDLKVCQPITFESMIKARNNIKGKVQVEFLAAIYEEDIAICPDEFRVLPFLQKTVTDYFEPQKKIKLPLIREILTLATENSAAEYFIYTNVDIGLYPNFYNRVEELIDADYDSFIINRRRLRNIYNSIEDLEAIYNDNGYKHPGFDCFVIKRSLISKLVLENICIGVPYFEISLAHNLFAYSNKFILVDDEKLTFHIGLEIFKKRNPKEYFQHNGTEFWKKIIPQIQKELKPQKIPYSYLPLPLRLIKWGVHPCFPIKLMIELELKRFYVK
jgi:hypothetical protein